MNSDKITNGQGFMLTVLMLMTNSYSVVYGTRGDGDAVLSNLLAGAAAVFSAWLLAYVCDRNPEKSFYAVLKTLFGGVFGRICAILLIVLAVLGGVVPLVVFNRFVQLTALPRTPQIIIPLILVLIASLSFRSGLHSAAGSARILFWFAVLVFAVFVAFGIKFTEPNFPHVSADNVPHVLTGAAEVFINRFGTLIPLMSVYTRMSQNTSRRAFFCSAVAVAGVSFSAIAFISTGVLGRNAAGSDFYPAFTVMSVIEVGGFLQHPEILSSIVMTMCAFFKIAVCILFVDDMVSGIFEVPAKSGFAVPIGLIFVSTTQLVYRNAPALRRMTQWRPQAGFLLAFELLVPVVLVCVLAFSRHKSRKT